MEAQGQEEPRGVERLPDAIAGFRIVRRLAVGGTSDVLLAQAKAPEGGDRPVVLKLLLAQYKDDPSFERMFALEAAAYARLSHPAIVKLYDFFATNDQLVMVLEHVDGLPLNALRAHLTNSGDVLDDRAVFYLMGRVFAALTAAHAAKDPATGDHAPVIHRDVNPSNVLIHRDGAVKLADFGIAKVTGMAGDTKQGFIKGTFGYMAPEQVRGEQVTVRADVYAATLLLWELLARRRAIQHGALSDLEALRAMAHPNIVSLDVLRGDLPASLRKIIARGLEASPGDRNVTAAELAKALADAGSESDGRARLAAALEKARAPDSQSLAETAPSPSIEESMALLAEADDQSAPPLPSYSIPAPPMSDSDFAETKLNTDARLPAQSIPDDVPTKPANVSEIAALAADDSLELPRFPMPPATEAPPPLTQVPDTTPDEKDVAKPPSSSRLRAQGARLGSAVAPRPAIPRPTSMAPGEPPPPPPSSRSKLQPPSAYTLSALTPPAKPDPALKRPHTIMGGFTAQAHAPTPRPTAASDNAKTEPMHMPPAMTPPPAQPRPQPAADLGRTLAMPGAPPPPAPAAFAATAIAPAAALPVVPGERPASSPTYMRNAMPTAPASFHAPRASVPDAQRSVRGWIIAGVGAFIGTAIAIAFALYATQTKTPAAIATTTATSAPTTTTPTTTSTATTTSMPTSTSPPTSPSTSTSAPTSTSTSVPTSTSTSPSIPPGKSAIVAGKSARQHRIFVDDKIVGEGPGTYFIGCGRHSVKVGSSGKPQEIDAPCGETVTLQ